MADLDLTIASHEYDTTRALFDGSVAIDGVNATMVTTTTLPEIFRRVLVGGEFDVAELGLTFFLRAREHDDALVGLPAFPNRVFRHSAIFVNADSGITGPADLVDRTIGEFGVWGQDPGVWMKGILADDYGFRPERNRWVIGGLDHPMAPFSFTDHPHPAAVDVTTAPEGATLSDMLENGEIDVLFTANVPQSVLDGTSKKIRRLFPDHEVVERDYHRRTGIFPIMHTVVVRRALLEAHPEAVRAVYRAFAAAKDVAAAHHREGQRLYGVPTMIPWINALMERNLAQLGEDWWPYGIAANRHALDTYLRYHHEQGLSSRRWAIADLFVPELLDT